MGIDQRSHRTLVARLGPQSQWPRTLYARAIDALVAAGARVIALAVFFDSARPEDAVLGAAIRQAGNVVIPVVAQGPLDFDPRPGVAQRFQIFFRSTPEVRRAAAAEGLANITVAKDSVVRGLPLLLRAGDEELPAMPLTIAALYARRPRVLDGPPGPGAVYAAGRAVPVAKGASCASTSSDHRRGRTARVPSRSSRSSTCSTARSTARWSGIASCCSG